MIFNINPIKTLNNSYIGKQLSHFTVFIQHVYGSFWRWKHWSVRQIKSAQLAFGRTLICLLTYLLTYLTTIILTENKISAPYKFRLTFWSTVLNFHIKFSLALQLKFTHLQWRTQDCSMGGLSGAENETPKALKKYEWEGVSTSQPTTGPV